MTAADCTTCLRSLPSTTEVEMDIPWDQPTQLIALLREDSTFLPALHGLNIWVYGPAADMSLSLLMDMVEWRSRGGQEGIAKLLYFRYRYVLITYIRLVQKIEWLHYTISPERPEGRNLSSSVYYRGNFWNITGTERSGEDAFAPEDLGDSRVEF
ncbi:hypothetical protein DFH08DRAFT_805315 [Mycena albidolilacea]|uniref:Uncharacterized protein n=1 Tax=Mycena albidolilacea TaxID=1033008 RepID=A0AAD7A8H7_9AGAR|nr:hypothetical protein DFH08DRAFT_805315 [Mycena albidolilacea]